VVSRLVSVAVPVPTLGALTYSIPDAMPIPPPGARVVVPLGPRTLTGIVTGLASATPHFKVRDVHRVIDADAFVPPDVVALTEWVAKYYLAGPGAALAAALPPRALTGRVSHFKTSRVAALTAAGRDAADRLAALPRGVDVRAADLPVRLRRSRGRTGTVPGEAEPHPTGCAGLPRSLASLGARQREALRVLASAARGLATSVLSERGVPAATLTRLSALGLVALRDEQVERDPFWRAALASPEDEPGREPTEAQRAALDHLVPWAWRRTFHVALVHGVTGSGKTEVYLRLADAVRRSGRGVLVLVPEIALTPQVAALFRGRFGAAVAIQHSGLSMGERHDQWHRIRRGDVDIVIGTRSAVFAPLARVGLIIVDEEHDASYKQEEIPRYHARDVAVMRGKLASALVVLGSATPTLESYANAQAGRYSLVTLDRRVLERPLARVDVVNMRDEIAAEGPDVVLSRAVRAALAARLERGEQALVLLNRRGFAAAVFCRQCGASVDCPNCSVALTVHTGGSRFRPAAQGARGATPARAETRAGGPGRGDPGWRARCHYCNYAADVPRTCPVCAAPYMTQVGVGTERVEAEIRAAFPHARVARVDRDAVRRKGSLVRTLSRVARKDLDILIGTQMIAKGHDFPDVTLVGVISADGGLGLPDFRAAERTFQLLTQVAGRAGRGERAGEAIIQSLVPHHYSIQLARTQDYRVFFEKEMDFRRAMRYPPHVAMVNVVVRGRSLSEAMTRARALAELLRSRRGFVVLGPAPAPLVRLRGEHRAQFFLKGTSRNAMREALEAALTARADLARHATVDVDPQTVL
jgi:primosomal protein N' (replication factor Y)